MWKYLKFGWLNWIVTLGTGVSFVLGGWWMWFGVGFMFIIGVGGELLSKEDNSEPGYRFGWIYDWIIYTISLFLLVSLITFVWAFSGVDLLGIGAFAQQFGYDALAARGEKTPGTTTRVRRCPWGSRWAYRASSWGMNWFHAPRTPWTRGSANWCSP